MQINCFQVKRVKSVVENSVHTLIIIIIIIIIINYIILLELYVSDGNKSTRSAHWSKQGSSMVQTFRFRCDPSLRDKEVTMYDIFADLLADMAIELICIETNGYADQHFQRIGVKDKLSEGARARKWTEVTLMRAFLGINLYMEMVKFSAYELYWSNEELQE